MTVIPQKINHDQLERNAALILSGRRDKIRTGDGKTVTYLYLLLGHAELCDDHTGFIYVCPKTFIAMELCDDFKTLLTSHQIDFIVIDDHTVELKCSKVFTFVSIRTMVKDLETLKDHNCMFLDVSYMNVHREFCLHMDDYNRTLAAYRVYGVEII